jgi:putative membrane protein
MLRDRTQSDRSVAPVTVCAPATLAHVNRVSGRRCEAQGDAHGHCKRDGILKNLALLTALLLATPTLAIADDRTMKTDASAKLADPDLSVVSELHHANQSEVDLGNYALAHGTKAIKDYATMIVKDHTANDAKLVALAKKHGTTKIPAPPMDKAEMDDMAKLKTMKGTDFDRAYVDAMVDGHQKNIAKVTAAIGTVANADLKSYLTDTKPALEHHLDTAKSLQSSSPQAQK